MTRPLRIQYPDAWYHVMNRGRHGESIYHDARDYQAFMALLEEVNAMWNIKKEKGSSLPLTIEKYCSKIAHIKNNDEAVI